MDRSAVREAAMQNGDPRPFLRMRDCREQCGKRPRDRRAAEEAQQLTASHSITSSARARIEGGTVMPSALAVLRLTNRPNVLACWTGRSAGLAPARIRPT